MVVVIDWSHDADEKAKTVTGSEEENAAANARGLWKANKEGSYKSIYKELDITLQKLL